MVLATAQPYFCPYPGFFAKACFADLLVLLDEVQFPQGTTWLSRNRFKNHQGTLWITIPVWKKNLGRQLIREVRICYEGRWLRKHGESLQTAYGHAPYLKDHLEIIEEMFSGRWERLIDLNLSVIRYLFHHLEIGRPLRLQSELGVQGKGTELLVELCKALRASTFLTQSQSEKYLNLDLFQKERIEVRFFRPTTPIYPQLWGDFIGNLSTLDLLFNCGPKSREILLGHRAAGDKKESGT